MPSRTRESEVYREDARALGQWTLETEPQLGFIVDFIDRLEPLTVYPVDLGPDGAKAPREVVRKRRRVVEGARVEPHARRTAAPGRLHRDRQEVLAQPSPQELGQQAEVG